MVLMGLPLPSTMVEPVPLVHTSLLPDGPAANTGMVIMAMVIAKTNWFLVFMLNSSLAVGFPSRLGY